MHRSPCNTIEPGVRAPCARNGAPRTLETKTAGAGAETASRGDGGGIGSVPVRVACRIVRQIVMEMVFLSGDRVLRRRDSRRAACHVRQIAMYVCHVTLQISLSDIGLAFGRDRTTVGHACNVVEDRRDVAGFDEFVATAERIVLSVFGPAGLGGHE